MLDDQVERLAVEARDELLLQGVPQERVRVGGACTCATTGPTAR